MAARERPSERNAERLSERNAVLLFSKPPVPGLVKTRLTKERGGNLTPEQAAEFFRCSFLDVADLVMAVLEELDEANRIEQEDDASVPVRSYDFYVSTTPASSVALFEEVFKSDGGWDGLAHPVRYLVDKGASFNEHFDDAFRQLFDCGYDNVVAIGGDMPTLPREHIIDAFMWLEYLAAQDPSRAALVLAPCQQSGVSLVAQTRHTPIDSAGVYYNLDGLPALDAYTAKLRETSVPAAYLSPVSDVDGDSDLAHAISCLNAIAEATRFQPGLFLARRTLEWIDRSGLRASAPPNEEHDPRWEIDV
ncbi:MAG: DUF2064 domain-containing protein [Coriobacteriales bacterium]|nr:DUF2064 domain-containing protein [Coriobacteriales bacterium]